MSGYVRESVHLSSSSRMDIQHAVKNIMVGGITQKVFMIHHTDDSEPAICTIMTADQMSLCLMSFIPLVQCPSKMCLIGMDWLSCHYFDAKKN